MELSEVRTQLKRLNEQLQGLKQIVDSLVANDAGNGSIVYVARTGTIYHTDRNCRRSFKGGETEIEERYLKDVIEHKKPCDTCSSGLAPQS